MTPAEIRAARIALGLNQPDMAAMLGYGRVRQRVAAIEAGTVKPHGAVTRLLRAYLDGYRPSDWPGAERGETP